MYRLHDYTWMITDEARMGPYVRALEAAVRPGSVVVDLGTGTGIFALLACRLGARRVFAIDTNDVVEVGRELALENGMADRIVFFQRDSREVDLPEPADVIVSDLRGVLPMNGDHLAAIADARKRFLKPNGVLVPTRDRLMVAVAERVDLYEWALGPARGPLGVTFEAMRDRLRQTIALDGRNVRLHPRDLLTAGAVWATLDYATVQPGPVTGRTDLRVERDGTGHGVTVWFEALLSEGEVFSTAPGYELCYGRLFLPWPHPVALAEGDVVKVDLWAQSNGDPWGWNTSVPAGPGLRESFKQSTFIGAAGKLASRLLSRSGSAISPTS
jgi:type I protein arginine methyltransferase